MLTNRQRAFVQELLVDMNGTQAAVRAGYAPASANVEASRLMAHPEIAAAVAVAMAQRETRTNVKADDVLHEMSLLSHSCIDHYHVDDEGNVTVLDGAPEGAMRAIQSIKRRRTSRADKDGNIVTTVDVEIKLWDKVAPLRLMGRHVGLFPDRVEHSGPRGGPIETVTRVERVIVDVPYGHLAEGRCLPEARGARPALEATTQKE